ncbi:MAG: hypothetical protein A2360_00085 [Candidatus Staskawiczbacteria bacterium RIFOXYB1_FULL_32_11]|uniref:Galactose oxidase n=1 Tax=Candidatus Staskawiczbacteria bacterium RIFOXYD1_FULL_32_13 TaxID=1802234 RepID=A0A1G2JTM9_9BACT|nr:MAG: hypothetical protein UR22_C0011G0016 [Parcubacteria group bacterium GW2011_GWC2_32_10]OGZ77914.1 MAG: hypothetical protein A2360_00085 [Candidatus Staskawiczbacteria bacterium RIFOXYB1_FULL_32_11]OGZ78320.1 MAG: hypothetical protein A2256_01635 [Candidatus Staskawiczbacteria bacterium RIFOXYA2_FULL_32_7]OGZ87782.1 MAG: hypothetical protein A2463_02610 [Candidatus Staskawiczbacteria bacterium RIFOXYC2_FULL_32_10]OGZ89608.1 MAG: hypothetical protein A2561_03690 [Candidatus Staskawiczbacte
MEIKKRLVILFCILFFLFIILVVTKIFYKNKFENREAMPVVKEVIVDIKPVFNPLKLDWQESTGSAEFEARDSHGLVAFKNKLWVMGGLNGNCCVQKLGLVDYEKAPHFLDVWSSEDGKIWKLENASAPWGKRRSIQVVEFKNKLFLLGGWGPEIGYKNDIWTSEDGINWKLEKENAEWSKREGHTALVFDNKIWVIGGVTYDSHKLTNDVWSSEDGIFWQKATDNAGFELRWDHVALAFNNKLWVIGGMGFDNKVFNDVWSSEDGIVWKQEVASAPFASRQGGGLVEFENKLWLISRLNADIYGAGVNDVWFSDNGINWQKTETDPEWSGREDVGVAVFKNKIWVVGGMDKDFVWENDVWSSK